MKKKEHIDFLKGNELYGDDMSPDEILEWYKSEEEGYSGIVRKTNGEYSYEYQALNYYHCFSRLKGGLTFKKALGIGSAYGEEFRPILSRIRDLTILDPSEVFASEGEIKKVPCIYIKPNPNGDMPFNSNTFDLITCFGVMHHIPNVSHVMNEVYRCLDVGGLFFIREPIVSQGDWRYPRKGVTKNERGIPENIFDRIIIDCGFEVVYRRYCDFQPLPLLARFLKIGLYNNVQVVAFDDFISNIFPWSKRYHRTKLAHKIAPASIVYVLSKKA